MKRDGGRAGIAILIPLILCLLTLSEAVASEGSISASQPSVRIVVDTAVEGRHRIPEELFGIAWNWPDSGGGLIEYGELLRDRSFRNQADAAKRAWIESPNPQTGGRVRLSKTGGHDRPWGGRSYPGYMTLAQESQGYTCISQYVWEPLVAGAEYELHLSSRAEGRSAGMSVFFADGKFMPAEKLDKLATVAPGAWSEQRFVLKPERSVTGGVVRICIVTAGEISLDEIRLHRLGGAPRVREAAIRRIRQLGVKSLRWPTGTDADFFEWRDSIQPVRERGEVPTQFGILQVPNLGLHEFLDFCEAQGIVPLVTVNIREGPERAAQLVEYILGPASSPMGKLRAQNGRSRPWQARHFELGNEPTELYKAEFPAADTVRGYIKLASAAAGAMRAKAKELDRTVELKGVVESTFAVADWISAVPMLAKWNAAVLDPGSGIRGRIDQIKGNFYCGFTWKSSESELFREVMAGGTTIASIVRHINRAHGPQPPFWLTEYGVFVRKRKLLGGDEILLERAKDYQSALCAADVLMTAIQERFGGAYLYNLAEWGTWGVIGNPHDLRLRPSGLAFSLLSGMAGEFSLPVRIEGARSVTLGRVDGNNPAKTQYDSISAVASRSDRGVQLIVLNRAYEGSERVLVDLSGMSAARAELQRLGPAPLTASNEEAEGSVAIVRSSEQLQKGGLLDLPARSLLAIRYTVR